MSSDAFLDRLQKGRPVVSDEGLGHHPVSVSSDSGKNISSPSQSFKTVVLEITCGKHISLKLILTDFYDVIA